MFEHFDYVSIQQLGQIMGKDRIEMGRTLRDIGLRQRDEDTKQYVPTLRADQEGFAKWVHPDGCPSGFYAWHREKTLAALELAGVRPADQPSSALETQREIELIRQGQFAAIANGGKSYQVRADDGSFEATVRNKQNAITLANALHGLQQREMWR